MDAVSGEPVAYCCASNERAAAPLPLLGARGACGADQLATGHRAQVTRSEGKRVTGQTAVSARGPTKRLYARITPVGAPDRDPAAPEEARTQSLYTETSAGLGRSKIDLRYGAEPSYRKIGNRAPGS